MDSAIFLDRDGVIIENRENYVRSCDDVVLIPAALAALRNAYDSVFKIILVTNQSVIGRGLITMEQADEINHYVKAQVTNSGGRLDGIFMCPHTPLDNCNCRKPRPGLLLQAAERLNLDLKCSYMIGDALSDIMAGRAAGVWESILVRTGRGTVQASRPEAQHLQPYPIFDTLSEAFGYIFSQPR